MQWLLILLFVLIGPNFIWLATSSVRIENGSDVTMQSIAYMACEKTHPVGTLQPGQFTFHFLEACGDDTLEIRIGESTFCRTYVEGELYHVDAIIAATDSVDCKYDDLLSSLFIAKVLW